MSAPSPRAREQSEFCLCRAVPCSGERTPPLDSGPSASPVRTPVRIPAVVLTGDALHAQLAEIDENLCRANLTPTQEAEHLAKRKEIWEAMQAAKSDATCITLPKTGRGNTQFAADTAKATGVDKSTVTRAVRRATEVCQEARDLIRGTKLDAKRPEPREQGSVDAAVSILLGARRAWHTRLAAEKALASLSLAEKPLLLLYAFEERSDAERVLQFAGLCGVRAPVAKFSLVKLMYPALFNAGAFSEDRPRGRRAVIDAEIRRADQLLGGWLRMGSAAFLLACALNPPTSGEIQTPTERQDVG